MYLMQSFLVECSERPKTVYTSHLTYAKCWNEAFRRIYMDSEQWQRTISANCSASVPGVRISANTVNVFFLALRNTSFTCFVKFDPELRPAHVPTDVPFMPVMTNRRPACHKQYAVLRLWLYAGRTVFKGYHEFKPPLLHLRCHQTYYKSKDIFVKKFGLGGINFD